MNVFTARRLSQFAVAFFFLIAATGQTLAQAADKTPDPLPAIPATSAVLIVDTPEGSAETEAQFQRRINTHIVSLRSEQNLRKMIASPNSETRKTAWFTAAANPRERAAWLRDHLHVRQITGTALIEVSLPDVLDGNDRRTILRDICDAYFKAASEQQTDQLGDRTSALNTIRLKIEGRLKQITDDMRNKQIQLNTDGGGIGRIGMKEMELSKLVAEHVDAQLRAAKAKSAYQAIVTALQQGHNPPELDEAIRSDPRIADYQHQLDDAQRRLEIAKSKSTEKELPATDPLGKNTPEKQAVSKDPAVAELQAETNYLQKKLDTLTSELTAKAKVSILEQAQLRATQATAEMESLAQKVEVLKNDLGDLSNMMVLYTTLQEEQKGLREQLRSVRAQIERIMSLQGTPGLAGIRWQLQPEADGF